jgi:hypothetical protein
MANQVAPHNGSRVPSPVSPGAVGRRGLAVAALLLHALRRQIGLGRAYARHSLNVRTQPSGSKNVRMDPSYTL